MYLILLMYTFDIDQFDLDLFDILSLILPMLILHIISFDLDKFDLPPQGLNCKDLSYFDHFDNDHSS